MRVRRAIWIAGSTALAGAGVVFAGPLKSEWVSPKAGWVVHVDVEGFVSTGVGSYLVSNRASWDEGLCEEMRLKTGMDVTREILGVTVYGGELNGTDAVAVVHTTAALDSYLDRLRAEEGTYRVVLSGERRLDAWMEHGQERFGYVVERGEERVIIVGRAQQSVEAAIARVEADATSAGAPGRAKVLERMPRPGSVVFVAAEDVSEAASRARAATLRKMRSVRMEIGEAKGELFAEMLFTAGTEEDAGQLFRMIDGSIAAGRVVMQGEAGLEPLVEMTKGLELEADGASVKLRWSHEGAGVVEALKGIAAAKDQEKETKKEDAGDGSR